MNSTRRRASKEPSDDRLCVHIKFIIPLLIVHKLHSMYTLNTPSRWILSCTFTPKFTFTCTFFLVLRDLRTHLAMIKYPNESDKLPYFLCLDVYRREVFSTFIFSFVLLQQVTSKIIINLRDKHYLQMAMNMLFADH